jgi:hypothetical protein
MLFADGRGISKFLFNEALLSSGVLGDWFGRPLASEGTAVPVPDVFSAGGSRVGDR